LSIHIATFRPIFSIESNKDFSILSKYFQIFYKYLKTPKILPNVLCSSTKRIAAISIGVSSLDWSFAYQASC
jgi:hypothetical protein